MLFSAMSAPLFKTPVGMEDAPYLVREFQPKLDELDLLQLPNFKIYLKLMIDGTPSRPFSAATLMLSRQGGPLGYRSESER